MWLIPGPAFASVIVVRPAGTVDGAMTESFLARTVSDAGLSPVEAGAAPGGGAAIAADAGAGAGADGGAAFEAAAAPAPAAAAFMPDFEAGAGGGAGFGVAAATAAAPAAGASAGAAAGAGAGAIESLDVLGCSDLHPASITAARIAAAVVRG